MRLLIMGLLEAVDLNQASAVKIAGAKVAKGRAWER